MVKGGSTKIDAEFVGLPRSVDNKGRIHIPAYFRKIMGVKPNDTLVCYLTKDGYLIIKKKEDNEECNEDEE